MTNSLLRCGKRGSGKKGAARGRRSFLPRLLLLEDRTLPSVQFTPGPYTVPGNRPDTALGALSGSRPVEPYLSVNPSDSGNIAVSSGFGMRVSTAAGARFLSTEQFPAILGGQGGDTSSTFDAAGRLFWTNLTTSGGLSGIGVAQVDPTTGGYISAHAVDQVPDNTFSDDKDFIAADPTNGNLYVIWTRFGPSPTGISHVMMRYSSDQGVTWSIPVQVDSGSDTFAWPATVTVAADHTVYAAYHSVTCSIPQPHCGGSLGVPNHDGEIVVVRYNNDLTNPRRSIAEVSGRADVTFNLQTAGYTRTIPGATFVTAGSAQAWILADPARPGNVYVVSEDSNNGFHQDYGDVRIARSTDYGATWSSSLIQTSSALFPNAAIDQFGDIVVAWYDNRRALTNAAGHFKLDVYATYSADGGITFAPAFPVNDQTPGVNTPNGNTFDPDPGATNYVAGPPPTTRIGEYFGIGVFGGTAYVAWNGNVFNGFNHPISQQVWTKSFGVRGSLTISTAPGENALHVRTMEGNPEALEVVLNGERQYAGLWSALADISVDATLGVNSFIIDNTVIGIPLTVNFGDSLNALVLGEMDTGLSVIQGPVIIHGGTGTIVTFVDDPNFSDTNYTITAASFSRPGSAIVLFDHVGRGLNVRGGGGDATFDILDSAVPLNIIPGFGANTVEVDDHSNVADTTYTITGTMIARSGEGTVTLAPPIGASPINVVLTGGSGNNAYIIAGTTGGSTTLDTGDGSDTLNVRGTGGLLLVNAGSGGDTIILSSAAATLAGIGHVILNDPSNSAAVIVDDSGIAGGNTYTVTSSQVAASAWPNFLLIYNNPASLTLNGGSGDDEFAIESTAGATATTVNASSGGNRFDLTPTNQYLADLAGPVALNGGGSDTLVFWDQNNRNAETYAFDDVPSSLTLATVPVSVNFMGMGSIYLETNGMSTVDDPSGTVFVDMLPPSPPAPAPSPGDGPHALDEGWLPPWFIGIQRRHVVAPWNAAITELWI